MEGAEWILGLGVVFGLAFVFTLILEQGFEVFLIFVAMFITFAIWAELLPVWTLIIVLVGITGVVYLTVSKKGGK